MLIAVRHDSGPRVQSNGSSASSYAPPGLASTTQAKATGKTVEAAAQVRVAGANGTMFAFHLCPACAQDARKADGARLLHPQAAREGETTTDPRYERALEIARRRKRMRRIK